MIQRKNAGSAASPRIPSVHLGTELIAAQEAEMVGFCFPREEERPLLAHKHLLIPYARALQRTV